MGLERPDSMIPPREIIPGETPGYGTGHKVLVVIKAITLIVPLLEGLYWGIKKAVREVGEAWK